MPVLPQSIDAYIFYFDLLNVRQQFLHDQQGTLERIRAFQEMARQTPFPFGDGSALKTFADNVWARVASHENIADVRLLDLAGDVMRAAHSNGFDKFFGVITYGKHPFDLFDRTLVTGGDPTEILVQHIDMTSEPHMRAAFAEKWSASLAKLSRLPVPPSCVWVSEEVFPNGEIEDNLFGVELSVAVVPERFDLKQLPGPGGAKWPFKQSRFRAIVAT